ncbi:MAG: hypothetical protein PHN69_05015 [Candidatus Pacebacteria bacterium]|nr:hypothetical protein [Candidatus Paceibacterota bacterium]
MDKLSLLVIGLIISFVLFIGFDYGLGDRVPHNGIITNKVYEPAHYYTTMVVSGKVMVPVRHQVGDRYKLTVQLNDGTITSVEVNHEDFSITNIGDSACVNIKVGKVTKWRY